MVNEDRYTVIYDEVEWILDQETGEYMDIEQACNKLNDFEESMGVVGGFIRTFDRLLDEAEKEEGV